MIRTGSLVVATAEPRTLISKTMQSTTATAETERAPHVGVDLIGFLPFG